MKVRVTVKKKTTEMIQTKYGKKEKTNLQVLTEKGKTLWVGGFSNAITQLWKEGDDLDLEVEQNGKYWNFKTPSMDQLILEHLDKILKLLSNGTNYRSSIMATGQFPIKEPPMEEEIEPEEITEDDLP